MLTSLCTGPRMKTWDRAMCSPGCTSTGAQGQGTVGPFASAVISTAAQLPHWALTTYSALPISALPSGDLEAPTPWTFRPQAGGRSIPSSPAPGASKAARLGCV